MPIPTPRPIDPMVPRFLPARRLGVCLACVAVLLALVSVDLLLTPAAVHLRVLFSLPLLCLAWNHARALAWSLALTVYPLHLVLYPAGPLPVSWLGPAMNLGLSLTVLGLEIEMVWRARHMLQQLAQAVHRTSSR
jgi:hypothetical protein